VKEDMKEKAELLKDATPYEEKKEDAPKGFGMLRRDSLGELDDKLAAPKGINVSLTRANAVAKKPDPNLIAFDQDRGLFGEFGGRGRGVGLARGRGKGKVGRGGRGGGGGGFGRDEDAF
jgi:hypothetical protein